MKYLLAAFLVLLVIPLGLSQVGFKKSFALSKSEGNDSFQCLEIDSSYYFSGGYFDGDIGRWTVYFAVADNNGNVKLLGTEKTDTIDGSNVCNKMVFDSSGLYIVGSFRDNLILHYNFLLDSISIVQKINPYKNDIGVFGLAFDHDNNYLMSGITVLGNGTDQDIKIIKYKDSIICSFIDIDTAYNSACLLPLVSSNGRIYLACFDQSNDFNKNDQSYIICLDSNFNIVFSTKNSTSSISMSYSKGALLDKNDNIIVSGFDVLPSDQGNIYEPKIAKFDKDGKPLWQVSAGKPNIYNYEAWGSWQNIIEAQEGDGYVLAGSHFTGSKLGDQELSDGALTKISSDGVTIWSKTYSFREGTNRVYCLFNDVVATCDGGYFAVGQSINASAPVSQILDPPGFRSIILKTDANGNFMSDTTSTIDVAENTEISILHVYPNPASEIVYISQKGHSTLHIQICDAQGKIMDAFECTDKDHNIIINTSSWLNGTYFISYHSDKDATGYSQFLVVH